MTLEQKFYLSAQRGRRPFVKICNGYTHDAIVGIEGDNLQPLIVALRKAWEWMMEAPDETRRFDIE